MEELLPLAREHDVGFIAMKPFGGGRIRKANLAFYERVAAEHGMSQQSGY